MELASSPQQFAADPVRGRMYTTARVVRGTEVTTAGRLRFDALARYLQEAAEDDLADAGWCEPQGWLLRRCAVVIHGYPGLGDRLSVRTFCSAIGPRWAGRTTALSGSGDDLIQAGAVWAAVDRETGRPSPLGDEFHRLYGPSAQGRSVTARLSLPAPPRAQDGRSWPLRATDFDTAGHVNNTVHWAAVEEVLAGVGWLPAGAELDYHRPIRPGSAPLIVSTSTPDQLGVWLLNGSRLLAAARLTR